MGIGGPQKLISELLPALKATGMKSSLLVYETASTAVEEELRTDGIDVFSLGVQSHWSPRIVSAIREKSAGFDLVNVHLEPAMYHVPMALSSHDIPMVLTLHEFPTPGKLPLMKRFLRRYTYMEYDRLITPTECSVNAIVENVGGDNELRERISVVASGLNLEKHRAARRAPNFGLERKVIAAVSQFNDTKDQRTLMRAMPLVADTDFKVAFIGHGPTFEEHRRYADMLGISRKCLFLGLRDDVPSLAAGSTIGVLSSNRELFPFAALELMAAGKPVVASDLPSIREVVDGAGLLFQPGDETGLAMQINRLFEDSTYYRQVADACLERSELYSVDFMARGYAEVYESVIASRR